MVFMMFFCFVQKLLSCQEISQKKHHTTLTPKFKCVFHHITWGMDRVWKSTVIGFSLKVWLKTGISVNSSLRRDFSNKLIEFFLT
jgi:hypothetical protein